MRASSDAGRIAKETLLDALAAEVVALEAADLCEARSGPIEVNARLAQEREFVQTLVENLAEGVVACDAGGAPILMNRVAREAVGVAAGATLSLDRPAGTLVLGADGVNPIGPDDLPLVRALRDERPKDQPFTIVRDGAAPRTYLASGDSFRNSAGEKLGAVVVLRDETERQAMVQALRRSEEKFEAAFRASPDAVNINRLSDGLYVEVNASFTELTGYTEGDVKGKTSLELSLWESPGDRDRLIAGLEAEGSIDKFEAGFRRKDGSVTIAEMSARLIEVGGQLCVLSVTRDVSERTRVVSALEASNRHLERMSRDVVETLGRVVEARDPYTQGHEQRVAELCRLIATRLGMPEEGIVILETAALVHDLGKLGVPVEILVKPGKLSAVEYEIIKEHPQRGYEILKGIAFDWPIAEIVLQHHERMDGSGYPQGLCGEDILPSARLLAIADVVEAMATDRPYRAALGLKAALEELRANPDKYDKAVVAALETLCDDGCVAL